MSFFRLLLWAHGRMFLAWLRGTWRDTPLLIFVLAGLILGYVGLGYWLFFTGLKFLYNFPLVGSLLSQRVLFLVFAFFFVMLVFSNLIIGYTTLFRNRETAWFLSLPIAPRHVYRWILDQPPLRCGHQEKGFSVRRRRLIVVSAHGQPRLLDRSLQTI